MTYTNAAQIMTFTAGFVMKLKLVPLSKITEEVARLVKEQSGDDRSLIPLEDRKAMNARIEAGILEIAKRPIHGPQAIGKPSRRTKDHH